MAVSTSNRSLLQVIPERLSVTITKRLSLTADRDEIIDNLLINWDVNRTVGKRIGLFPRVSAARFVAAMFWVTSIGCLIMIAAVVLYFLGYRLIPLIVMAVLASAGCSTVMMLDLSIFYKGIISQKFAWICVISLVNIVIGVLVSQNGATFILLSVHTLIYPLMVSRDGFPVRFKQRTLWFHGYLILIQIVIYFAIQFKLFDLNEITVAVSQELTYDFIQLLASGILVLIGLSINQLLSEYSYGSKVCVILNRRVDIADDNFEIEAV